MPESIDQEQLLSYVEDELSPDEAEVIRQRLATEPALLAAVERLREDRAVLRATPEPPLPRDLVAGLDSVLARPMLVETEPGSYRRQRRQRTRRPRLLPIALAAGLLLVGGVVITLLTVALNGGDTPSTEMPLVAIDQNEDVLSATPSETGEQVTSWPPAGTAIHHAPPTGSQVSRLANAESTPAAVDDTAPIAPTSDVLPFALVVHGDPDANRDLLGSLVAGHATDMAFVRNFSFEEAVQIEQRWLRQRDGQPARPAVVAGGTGSAGSRNTTDAYERLVNRIREQLRQESSGAASGTIAGRRGLEPSLEEQLMLSRKGASFTIAIPVSQLSTLLASLAADGAYASLRLLPDDVDGTVAASPDWASERMTIRDAVDAYRASGADRLVMLPVALQTVE